MPQIKIDHKKMLDDLEQLAKINMPTFNEVFKELHHVSRPSSSLPYQSTPSTFRTFVGYCRGKSGLKAQNIQTIQRAHKYLTLLHSGTSHLSALETAWKEYPLVLKDYR